MGKLSLILNIDEKPIINEAKLKSQTKSHDLNVQRVHSFFDGNVNMATIGDNDLESIIHFTKSFGLKILFYEYFYLDKDDLFITDMTTEHYEEEVMDLVQNQIDEYNDMVERSDFSNPAILKIFTIYEGHVFGITMADLKLSPIYSCDPNTRLRLMISEKEDEVNGIQEKKRDRDLALREELKDMIIADEKFSLCKNQSLRLTYMYDLLFEEKNTRYKILFSAGSGHIYKTQIRDFIDSIWNEIKFKSNS